MSEITEDALRFLTDQAVRAAGAQHPVVVYTGEGGKIPTVIMAPGQELKSVEHLYPGRSRFRGELNTSSLADFAEYAKQRHADDDGDQVQVFIDAEAMRAKAFFNLGNVHEPGHGDDTALLNIPKTAAFKAVGSVLPPKVLDQRELAEFIEDWRDFITPFTGYDADGAYVATTVQKAIAAVRKVTIEAMSKSDSAVGDMSASQSTLASIEAKSIEALPIALGFKCVPYEGLPERAFVLRVAVRTSDKTPHFVLRIVREQSLAEQIAQDFKAVLGEALGDAASLTIGVFNPDPPLRMAR